MQHRHNVFRVSIGVDKIYPNGLFLQLPHHGHISITNFLGVFVSYIKYMEGPVGPESCTEDLSLTCLHIYTPPLL